eukprot:Amastigsp_a347546_99.p2 type:complete len:159 gc:universal Amastigsp_a347546_99:491-15(-)
MSAPSTSGVTRGASDARLHLGLSTESNQIVPQPRSDSSNASQMSLPRSASSTNQPSAAPRAQANQGLGPNRSPPRWRSSSGPTLSSTTRMTIAEWARLWCLRGSSPTTASDAEATRPRRRNAKQRKPRQRQRQRLRELKRAAARPLHLEARLHEPCRQ